MLPFFKRRNTVPARSGSEPLPALPPGIRVYAIGDIHGRSDLLNLIQQGIAEQEARRPPARTYEIILGDMIDRGPDSRGVIEQLVTPVVGRERILLRGNHEIMAMQFLAEPEIFAQWRDFGGYETLMSYGIPRRAVRTADEMTGLRDEFLDVFPAAHRAALIETKLSFALGNFLFVHAGVRPGVPLSQQSQDDLCWIREPFLSHSGDFGAHIVHGHTPVKAAECVGNRTNIDTGAYATHHLTCLILEGASMQRLTTYRRTAQSHA
ncbi:MAG: metallophosphoesterase family protein [Beijerinckiaceae bacterium]